MPPLNESTTNPQATDGQLTDPGQVQNQVTSPAPTTTEMGNVAAPTTADANTGDASWIPEKYKNDPSINHFSKEGICQSYSILNSQRGRSILIPTENAGKEDMDKFFNRLTAIPGVQRTPDNDNEESMNQFYNSNGRPQESSGYQTDFGEMNKNLNTESVQDFRNVAHTAGLTNEQYKAVVSYDLQRTQQHIDNQSILAQSGLKMLEEKWGPEINNRKAGVAAAARVYKEQFPEHFAQVESVLSNNPAMMQMLSDIGMQMQEKGMINAPYAHGGDTPESADEGINEIRNNKDHDFHHPERGSAHIKAQKDMRNFYAIKYPGTVSTR